MSLKPKSYKDIMSEMTDRVLASTDIKDLHAGSAMKSLLESLEASMFGGVPEHEQGLRRTLGKLGIKSAHPSVSPGSLIFGAPLQMESLDATLSQVTFDADKLKLWPKPK